MTKISTLAFGTLFFILLCSNMALAQSTGAPPITKAPSAAQLAIQNGIEHGAHRIEVTAELDHRTLAITVEDDGPGFDAVEVLTVGRLDASSGLGRMHSLAENVSIRSKHAGQLQTVCNSAGAIMIGASSGPS